MQVTAITTIAPTDPQFAEPVQATVATVINELADAGLTVTAADISETHPVARLVTRAAAVYFFLREESYSPVHLAEFSDLAASGPTVFQLGNGPLRNIDGENLQAPGMGVKVPVAADALTRRSTHVAELLAREFPVRTDVPPVLGLSEMTLRPVAELEAMMRSQALVGHMAALILAGEVPESDDLVSVGRGLMTSRERDFLAEVGRGVAAGEFQATPSLLDEAQIHLTAAAAAEALAWLMGRVSVGPERLDAAQFHPGAWLLEPTPLATGPAPDLEQVADALDLVHLLHHSEPEWLGTEARQMVRGWNRALGWAVWPGGLWGQTERVI